MLHIYWEPQPDHNPDRKFQGALGAPRTGRGLGPARDGMPHMAIERQLALYVGQLALHVVTAARHLRQCLPLPRRLPLTYSGGLRLGIWLRMRFDHEMSHTLANY